MALKGKFVISPGVEAASAYARIDTINGGKSGWNGHVNIHSAAPTFVTNEDKSLSRTDMPVLQHFTVFADYVEGKTPHELCYAAAAKDDRLAGFISDVAPAGAA